MNIIILILFLIEWMDAIPLPRKASLYKRSKPSKLNVKKKSHSPLSVSHLQVFHSQNGPIPYYRLKDDRFSMQSHANAYKREIQKALDVFGSEMRLFHSGLRPEKPHLSPYVVRGLFHFPRDTFNFDSIVHSRSVQSQSEPRYRSIEEIQEQTRVMNEEFLQLQRYLRVFLN